jgi:acyl-coenzyme A thioesterase 9
MINSLDMLNPLDPRRDLRLSGHVIHTGRSSMEIAVKMESIASAEEGADETVLIGAFPSLFALLFIHTHLQVDSLWYAAMPAPTVRGRCILS